MVQLPEPFASIPIHQIRYSRPSPIHEFGTNLKAATRAPNQPDLRVWMKRDDQAAPMVCCGNKYRKLEYIIPDILSTPGVTTIVTEGGLQSNHAVQVAAVSAKLGLECVLLLDEQAGGLDASENPEIFRSTGNIQICQLLGADIRVFSGSYDKDTVLAELRTKEKVPYWIPMGASGLGYARCAFEIATQEEELLLEGTGRFDYIFLPCGSGSTLAGLIAGFRLLEKSSTEGKRLPPRQIIGLTVSPKEEQEKTVLEIARTTGGHIGLDPQSDLTLSDVRLDHRSHGTGYGILDTDTERSLREIATQNGVLMDPVYSGKAAGGMISFLRSGELEADARKWGHDGTGPLNILVLHTGGQTVYSAYATTSTTA
ncbi:unnamed protein product [Penicillium pancosmium]